MEDLELYFFIKSVRSNRQKSITRKHLTSKWELAIDKEEELVTGTPELCSTPSPNIRKIKNITSKHLPSEYQVKECQEKAPTFAIQLSDRKVQGMSNRNLGTAFHPLGECQKAKDYQEKALAFAIEISDTKEKV